MMRQLYLTPKPGSALTTGTDNSPVLRTMSLAFLDKFDVADNVHFDYGFDFQSVSYIDRLNYASPFIRATYDAGSQGRIRVGFSSGSSPAELLARDEQKSGEFDQDLTALAMLPRVSLSDAHVAVQRTQNFEIGYERIEGSRTYSAGVYRESVSNAAFMLAGADDSIPTADLLPDLSSRSSILNIGSYQRVGYTAGIRQALGDNLELSVAAGQAGALMPSVVDRQYLNSGDLRAGISRTQRPWVTMRASGIIPKAGTRIVADYGWTDFDTLMPMHVFLTQKSNQDIGVNVFLRQPLPMIFPWRMEFTAELRNMLAQGYLPIGGPGSRTVLTNSPRAVRGGLNFIF
jgi:hypothetical protein